MSQGNLERIREIFLSARALPVDQRAAFLKSECSGDADLQREVEQLLANDDEITVSVGTAAPLPRGMPSQIGPYKILGQLGEGGMGTVFKAEQRAPLKRIVAIKVVKAGFDTAEVLARFQAEHQALARLEHPNIARVFDAGTTEFGRPYFVMEYLPGQPITRFCDDNKLSIRERLELFQQACDAVTHAHIKAIVHRDIKSSNVLAFMQDGKPMVKVIDFGIAKALTGDRLTDLTFDTGHGVVVGTYDSMSPEQADGSADIDTRTDVYSLGVLLYELLAGAKPFDVKTFARAADVEIRRIIREVDPPRPSTRFSSLGKSAGRAAAVRQSKIDQLARELKGDLEWIPLKAMRKERQGRYVSPLQMSEDIDNYLNNRPLIARPESAVYRLRKYVTRHARPLGIAISIILIASAAITFHFHQVRQEQAKAYSARLGEAEARRSEAEGKLANLRQVQKAQSDLISVELEQAEVAARHGEWLASLTAYDTASGAGCTDFKRVLMGRVLSLQNMGRSADARRELQAAVRLHGELADDPIVMIRHGELWWSDDSVEGEKLLRAAIQRPLPPAELEFANGLLANSIPEAIGYFKRAAATDPFRKDAIGLTAMLSSLLGKPDAQEATIVWMRMFPDDPNARILRSTQLALDGDGSGAKNLIDSSTNAIDPAVKADLQRIFDLLVSLRKHQIGSGGAASTADLMAFIRAAAQDLNRFSTANLLIPKCLGNCRDALLAGMLKQTNASMLQGMGLKGPAVNALNGAVDDYARAEKLVPIAILYVMRADAMASAGRFGDAADEYEKALATPSPIDITGYAHSMAMTSLVSEYMSHGKTGLPIVRDPRISFHALKTAESGICGTDVSMWKLVAYIAGAGRHTEEARSIIRLWKAAMPTDPNTGVLEALNEYCTGNYGTALRLLDAQAQSFPQYDFSVTAGTRAACSKAIADRKTTPPPQDELILDLYYSLPQRPTTKPAQTH